MGKGDRAFSLPPPLFPVNDTKVQLLQRDRVSAVPFGKAAPARSPHPSALGGLWNLKVPLGWENKQCMAMWSICEGAVRFN